LTLVIDTSADGPVGVRTLSSGHLGNNLRATQPLVELLVPGAGRARASHRFSETAVGRRMRYAGSEQKRDGVWHELRVDLRDDDTGLTAQAHFRSADGVGACQVRTRVANQGQDPVLLLGITSLATGLIGHSMEDLDLVRGDSEWLGEGRWTRQPLRDGIADLNLRLHGQDGRGRFAVVSKGTWSTGAHLPTGGIVDRDSGHAWLWQVEHNGAWRWEVGERLDGAYLALLGPVSPSPPYRRLSPSPATAWTARSPR
jgi:alpha-galactosidase